MNKVTYFSVILTSVVIAACAGEKTASEYLDSANSHLEAGEFRAALIETRNAVSQSPADSAARLLLGELELKQGNPAGAEGALNKAIELGTPVAEVTAKLAEAYFFQGKLEELKKVSVVSLSGPDKARVLGYQAEAAIIDGDLSLASALSAEALLTDPVSPVALTASARLQFLEHNTPEARTYLAAALDETPGYSSAWELLGDIETSENRLPEAVTAYSRALEFGGNGISALFKRARTHLALDDFESTAADIKIFEDGDINSPAVGLLKAEVFLREAKLSEAQLALEESLKNGSDYLPAIRTLALTHMLRGNLGQAEQFAKQYFDNSDSDDSRVLLATIRLQGNRFSQAEQTLLPLADTGRLNVLSSQVLATTQLKQAKFDEAAVTMLVLQSSIDRAGITEPTPLAMLSSPSTTVSAELIGLRGEKGADADIANADMHEYLSEVESLFVEAVGALASQDTEKALTLARSLVTKEPDNADFHTLLARIHASSGEEVAAEQSLQTAMELESGFGSAIVLSAIGKLNSGNTDVARTMLEDALRSAQGPVRERILLALATVDASSGDANQVVARLKQANNENPSSYQPSLALAKYYTEKAEPEKVVESLSGLSSTGLQNPVIIELKAQAQIALGKFDEAISLVTPMVQSEPDTALWRFLRAKANAGKNNSDAVNRDLEVALRIDPNFVPAKLAQANLSILDNDFQQAEILLSQLETQIPGSDTLSQLSDRLAVGRENQAQSESARNSEAPPTSTAEVMDRARLHWSANDQEQAIKTMVDWLETNPNDVTIRLTLANTYNSLNRGKDAADTFREVLRVDDDNFIALNNLAWQLRKEDPENAIKYANRAVELQPDNPATLDTLAVIQFEQGMLPEAAMTFERIEKLEPTDPTILFHGARILAALGRNADAKNILEPLLSNNVDFPDLDSAKALYDEL